MKKPDSVVMIPGNIDSFFRKWFEFLEPFHRLTAREMDVATAFVKQRYKLSKVVKDPDILDKVLMSEDTKKAVREESNITLPHFQVPLKEYLTEDVINELRTCFTVPSLCKLVFTYERYLGMKKRFKYLNGLKSRSNA